MLLSITPPDLGERIEGTLIWPSMEFLIPLRSHKSGINYLTIQLFQTIHFKLLSYCLTAFNCNFFPN